MKGLSGKKLCRLLEKNGWELKRIKGSHHIYSRSNREEILTIPVHGNKQLKIGLLNKLLKDSGLK